jgi:hypothetical protein
LIAFAWSRPYFSADRDKPDQREQALKEFARSLYCGGDVEKLAADIRVLRPLRFVSEPRRFLAIFLGSR